jgi:hypothetical protein
MEHLMQDETTRQSDGHRDWARAYDDLPAVAPAVAALTLAAAGLTLVAAYWLLRSSRETSKRANFPAPAVHRRS